MHSEPLPGNSQGLHVVAKPIGAACNLDCAYCFYLEKHSLYATAADSRMSGKVLEAFVQAYVTSQPTPVVEFVWQGGEPTLLGLDFFEQVVALQQPYVRQKTITNALQTNGTLLTDAWCRCFSNGTTSWSGSVSMAPRRFTTVIAATERATAASMPPCAA